MVSETTEKYVQFSSIFATAVVTIEKNYMKIMKLVQSTPMNDFFTIFLAVITEWQHPLLSMNQTKSSMTFIKKIEEISKIILYEYWYFLRSTILKNPRSNLNLDNRLFDCFLINPVIETSVFMIYIFYDSCFHNIVSIVLYFKKFPSFLCQTMNNTWLNWFFCYIFFIDIDK